MRVENTTVKWFYQGDETHCEVRKDNETVAVGVTTKYAKDKPNKRVARHTSFQRAMTQAKNDKSLTKGEREAIWKTYRNTINQPVE